MFTLGIDSSTQGVKALVYDAAADAICASAAVNYGKDLPAFNSPEGFLPNEDVKIRRANPLMWVAGLELLLSRLSQKFDLSKIDAISGDGQQHGSVYLNANWHSALASLQKADSSLTLEKHLQNVFSRESSPIWMDTSTREECRLLTKRFGEALQLRTGSPAIERFTGPQIYSFIRQEPEAYAKTVRIHLVSSFLCSLLAGEDAPIDTGDGAGMNLLNLSSGEWDKEICTFIDSNLESRLPAVYLPGVPIKLRLAAYWTRYGLRAGIPVAPWTGDNPAALVGTGADRPGVAVISLGTSDVFFAAMKSFATDPAGYGHVFGNPSGGCMSLVCVKNGSLARERVMKELGCDFRFFDETAFAMQTDPTENKRAFPFFEMEIAPLHEATGIEANFDWASASMDLKVRALIRGQIQNLFDRTRWIGQFDEIRVTGGASRSAGIRQTIEQIFGAKVRTQETTDAAALGGALMALRALKIS